MKTKRILVNEKTVTFEIYILTKAKKAKEECEEENKPIYETTLNFSLFLDQNLLNNLGFYTKKRKT